MSILAIPLLFPLLASHKGQLMALVKDATAHPWADLLIEQPRHSVELSGREDSLFVSGEFFMFG